MQFVYSALWFIMAFVLVLKMGKENKIFYVAGGLFFVFGIWWLIDAINPSLEIFAGVTGIIFKVLIGIVLILACIVYFREQKKQKNDNTKN